MGNTGVLGKQKELHIFLNKEKGCEWKNVASFLKGHKKEGNWGLMSRIGSRGWHYKYGPKKKPWKMTCHHWF